MEENDLWKRHSRHVFITTAAGKPVWSLWGDVDSNALTTLCSVLQAVHARCSEGSTSAGAPSISDDLQCICTKRESMYFVARGPILLVCLCRAGPTGGTGEGQHAIRQLLRALHGHLLLGLTAQLHGRLQARPSLDPRPLLRGTDLPLRTMVRLHTRSPALFLDAYPCLTLPHSTRARVHAYLSQAGHLSEPGMSAAREGAFSSSGGVVYAVLLAGYTLVAWAQPKGAEHALRPLDVSLLSTFLACSGALRHADAWTPLCLPGLSEAAYVHAYITCLGSVGEREAREWPGQGKATGMDAAVGPAAHSATTTTSSSSSSSVAGGRSEGTPPPTSLVQHLKAQAAAGQLQGKKALRAAWLLGSSPNKGSPSPSGSPSRPGGGGGAGLPASSPSDSGEVDQDQDQGQGQGQGRGGAHQPQENRLARSGMHLPLSPGPAETEDRGEEGKTAPGTGAGGGVGGMQASAYKPRLTFASPLAVPLAPAGQGVGYTHAAGAKELASPAAAPPAVQRQCLEEEGVRGPVTAVRLELEAEEEPSDPAGDSMQLDPLTLQDLRTPSKSHPLPVSATPAPMPVPVPPSPWAPPLPYHPDHDREPARGACGSGTPVWLVLVSTGGDGSPAYVDSLGERKGLIGQGLAEEVRVLQHVGAVQGSTGPFGCCAYTAGELLGVSLDGAPLPPALSPAPFSPSSPWPPSLPVPAHLLYLWKPTRQYTLTAWPQGMDVYPQHTADSSEHGHGGHSSAAAQQTSAKAGHRRRKALLQLYSRLYEELTMPSPHLRHVLHAFDLAAGSSSESAGPAYSCVAGLHTTNALLLALFPSSASTKDVPAALERVAKVLRKDWNDTLLIGAPATL